MKLLTTGDVARICGVSGNKVRSWIDAGELPSFRIPLSRHRRVRPEDLAAFMERHGMGPVADVAEARG